MTAAGAAASGGSRGVGGRSGPNPDGGTRRVSWRRHRREIAAVETTEPSSVASATAVEEFAAWVARRAHHLDLDSYDEHFGPEADVGAHAPHMADWHPDSDRSRP